MGTRKMTFTLPDDLADQFVQKVAARNRSHYWAEALAQKLQERDRQLVHACEVANRDAEVQAIQKEFDGFSFPSSARASLLSLLSIRFER